MLKRLGTVIVTLALTIGGIGFTIVIVSLVFRAHVIHSASDHIYDSVEQVPSRPMAIVFGAGIWPDGNLSHVLADRVDTAVDLYHADKVRKLLMTGDNRFEWYNEPDAMGQYAMSLGVPADDIVYDYAGRRTYDSCYRARHIFGIEEAILVTQRYHLPRAIYTAHKMGIVAVGMAADRRQYVKMGQFTVREVPALLAAWWETNLTHPIPAMGDPIELRYD